MKQVHCWFENLDVICYIYWLVLIKMIDFFIIYVEFRLRDVFVFPEEGYISVALNSNSLGK